MRTQNEKKETTNKKNERRIEALLRLTVANTTRVILKSDN